MSKSEPNTSLDKYGEIQPSPLLDLERKREEDPLLHDLPTNPKELEEKTKEILANLREKVAEVERDAAWEAHLRRFITNSANSELAGEEKGSMINVKKLLAHVDSVRIEEQDPDQERL